MILVVVMVAVILFILLEVKTAQAPEPKEVAIITGESFASKIKSEESATKIEALAATDFLRIFKSK